jgi:hypothetical protein
MCASSLSPVGVLVRAVTPVADIESRSENLRSRNKNAFKSSSITYVP